MKHGPIEKECAIINFFFPPKLNEAVKEMHHYLQTSFLSLTLFNTIAPCGATALLGSPSASEHAVISNSFQRDTFLQEISSTSLIESLTKSEVRPRDAINLGGGFSLFIDSFDIGLPLQQAADMLAVFYGDCRQIALDNIYQPPISTRQVFAYGGLTFNLEPDSYGPLLSWRLAAEICQLFQRYSQHGFAGGFNGVMVHTSGYIVYLSLQIAFDTWSPSRAPVENGGH